MDEFKQLYADNIKLRRLLTESKVFVQGYSSKYILKCILNELHDHYCKHKKIDESILNDFYAVDSNNKWIALSDPIISDNIEHLMHGSLKSFYTNINGMNGKVSLHDNILQNGLPLIMFEADDTIYAIKQREKWTTHLHLFKFQPIIYGMRCRMDVASDWLKTIDRDYVISKDDGVLNKLAATWLGIQDVSRITSDLIVDGNELIHFLEVVVSDPTLQCYFLLSGQDILFAYIQVNEKTNVKMVLPVGSVEYN